MQGKNAEFNANKIIDIFKGEDNDFSKAVCLNAAAGLIVSGNHTKFIDAYEKCKRTYIKWKSLRAFKKLFKMVENT